MQSLQCFPRFLKEIKAVCAFIRITDNRTLLRNKTPNTSDNEVARIFLAQTPPSFAKWRWNTLRDCVRYTVGIRKAALLRRRSWYGSCKDEVLISTVATAFGRSQFWDEVQYMDEFATVLRNFQLWGQGCPCHEAERIAGKEVDCPLGGLRLLELPAKLESVKSELVELAGVPHDGAVELDTQ